MWPSWRALHARGVKVVCYMDAGTYEPGRPDSAMIPASLTGWNTVKLEVHGSTYTASLNGMTVFTFADTANLVTTGGMRIVGNEIVQGKTTACTTCHGLDLMGVADIPPIAGRSASYIMRQIYDMQKGSRNGQSAQLMKMAIASDAVPICWPVL